MYGERTVKQYMSENNGDYPTTIRVSSDFRDELAKIVPKEYTYEQYLRKEILDEEWLDT